MFGLGMPEILLILAIALMVIGPKKLPDLAKTLGRAMGEFKKAAQDFKHSIDMENTVKEFEKPVKNDLKEVIDAAQKPSDTGSDEQASTPYKQTEKSLKSDNIPEDALSQKNDKGSKRSKTNGV